MQKEKAHVNMKRTITSQTNVQSGPTPVTPVPTRLLVLSITFTMKTNRGAGDKLG